MGSELSINTIFIYKACYDFYNTHPEGISMLSKIKVLSVMFVFVISCIAVDRNYMSENMPDLSSQRKIYKISENEYSVKGQIISKSEYKIRLKKRMDIDNAKIELNPSVKNFNEKNISHWFNGFLF